MRKFAQRASPEQLSFYPESYSIPEEIAKLATAFAESPGSLWISNPGGGARGEGIVVINKLPGKVNSERIVQRYIPRPLLIHGLKFDLRFYVSVMSLDPLRIYVHESGLVRLATEPYNENIGNLSNRSAHLTNFSINKNNPAFVSTDDLDRDGTGNKWTHRPFWQFLKDETCFDPSEVREEIEDAFVSVIISARDTFLQQTNHRISFEVFGFDVMLDADGCVSILEVNVTPAMGTSSKLDLFVKGPVVRDLYNLALIPYPSDAQTKLEGILKAESDQELIDTIAISEYELCQRRLGGFRCIYPTPNRVKTHSPLLTKRTPCDEALERWIALREAVRSELLGPRIDRLRKLVNAM
jgi:hypothetical protein